MALLTTTEKLEAVQAAIAKAELAQEMDQGPSGSIVRAKLKTLYDRETYLEKKLAGETNSRSGLARTTGLMRR